jgi:hypothetical protein
MHTYIVSNKTEQLTVFASHSVEALILAVDFLGLSNGRLKVVCIA